MAFASTTGFTPFYVCTLAVLVLDCWEKPVNSFFFRKVAAKLFILQGGAKPRSFEIFWTEPRCLSGRRFSMELTQRLPLAVPRPPTTPSELADFFP